MVTMQIYVANIEISKLTYSIRSQAPKIAIDRETRVVLLIPSIFLLGMTTLLAPPLT